ncbi:APC family permease [Pseudidiomarina mangrovi]|uniref:APC family permease n=1 Tax=Pseudidiomarina mangrovi TaxID=2487133 RepID=UPI000FCBC50D|nr:APC family permease [Pseudidiomarina mangrovi]
MHRSEQLQRTTGLIGAVILGLGSIIGTGAFVSIALSAELAGSYLLWAIALAALVAACNGLSSAQLAAIHPVSGGTYEYGYQFLNHDLGFIAGWLFVLAKSASAAAAGLAIGAALQLWLGGPLWLVSAYAAAVIGVFTLLVVGGVRRSNRVNALLVGLAVAALLVFVVYAGSEPAADTITVTAVPALIDVLAAVALMFVAYTGYGRVATMGEEVQQPRRTIPRAIIATVVVVTLLYLAVGWALLQLPAPAVNQAGLAAWMRAGLWQQLVMIGAVIAMAGVVLNLILGVSRVVLAMARRHDAPAALARLNADRSSAPAAVWATAAVMVLLIAAGDLKLAWSFSAFTVLVYYSITNLAALQVPAEQRFVPRWVSVLGLVSCLSLAVFVDINVLCFGSAIVLVGWLLHRWSWLRRHSS